VKRVAILFELVLNAGPDLAAAEQVAAQLRGLPPVPAGQDRVFLGPPAIRAVRGEDGLTYHEVSVAAQGVGHQPAVDAGATRLDLDPGQLRELARGLYDVLRRCRGYRAAFVGWNPEDMVDLAELEREWAEELRAGSVRGLVLADETIQQLRTPITAEPFAPDFSWMPYDGPPDPASR
jgi:hypothetical protein